MPGPGWRWFSRSPPRAPRGAWPGAGPSAPRWSGPPRAEAQDGLGKATPAVPGPRVQEGPTDAPVVAHALGHLADVGPHPLADVGGEIDEGDLHGQEGVGGVLDQLGGGDVGDQGGAGEALVELEQLVPRLV